MFDPLVHVVGLEVVTLLKGDENSYRRHVDGREKSNVCVVWARLCGYLVSPE